MLYAIPLFVKLNYLLELQCSLFPQVIDYCENSHSKFPGFWAFGRVLYAKMFIYFTTKIGSSVSQNRSHNSFIIQRILLTTRNISNLLFVRHIACFLGPVSHL